MSLQEIIDKTFEKLKTFKVEGLLPALRASEGNIEDVLNINGCANYQFSTCLVDLLKPKQVVELGGAMGIWSICVLHTLPKKSKLYSITLPENGLEFSYVIDKYPNFYPIVGDDLNIRNWKGINLKETDIWYFDSIHTEEQLRAELYLYKPFFKKGAILLFDDIRINEGMWNVWESLRYEKVELTDPCHWTGWGICKV